MEELNELFYTFLEGVVEESQLRTHCEGLMESFGKTKQVRIGWCSKKEDEEEEERAQDQKASKKRAL